MEPTLCEVSHSDAALLQFDAAPLLGTIIYLNRTPADLAAGEAYVFSPGLGPWGGR